MQLMKSLSRPSLSILIRQTARLFCASDFPLGKSAASIATEPNMDATISLRILCEFQA